MGRPTGPVGRLALALLWVAGCDTPPPSLTAPEAGARVGGDTLVPTVVAAGEYTLLLDGTPQGPGPISLVSLPDGRHTLAVRQGDAPPRDEREFFVDRTPPRIEVLRPAAIRGLDSPGAPLQVELAVADASPLTTVTVDGVTLTERRPGHFGGELPAPAADAPLTLHVSATDAAGNTTAVEHASTASLVRWQAGFPVEPGDWRPHLMADDAVLIALGDTAVVIGPDGRERFAVDAPGFVLVEALPMPDGGALLRLLNPTTTAASEVRWVSPEGKVTRWNRADAVPLALGRSGDVPVVAWRVGESAEVGRAPAPWPPAAYSGTPLPFEPRQMLPWLQDGLVVAGAHRLATLSGRMVVGKLYDTGEGPSLLASGDKVYVFSQAGVEMLEAPGQDNLRRFAQVPATGGCAVPPDGAAYRIAKGAERIIHSDRIAPYKAHRRAPPNPQPNADPCVLVQDRMLAPTADDMEPLFAPAAVHTAVRVGHRFLVLSGGPEAAPRAHVLARGEATREFPLSALGNVIRAVPLPDGLLVTGLSAVRPDKVVLLRLALGPGLPAPASSPTP